LQNTYDMNHPNPFKHLLSLFRKRIIKLLHK